MDKRDILQRIIAEGGDCEWAYEVGADPMLVCKQCPLAKLKKNDAGDWMSCYDAVDATEDNQNAAYMKAASELLCDLQIEEMLQEEECENKKS